MKTNRGQGISVSSLTTWPLLALILLLTRADFSYGAALANTSGRVNVGVGDNVAIAGVIISGSGVEHLVVRGLGTSLPFANRLMNPYLRLYNADGSVITENNNWRDTQEDGIIRNGLAPPSDLESAVNIFINPGSYTAILSGVNGGTGIGLLEVYELDRRDARLANMSTRGNVSGGGDNRGIVGVTITGDGTRDILFRGLGPSLPLANRLGNPYLELYNSSGNVIYANDNWKDSQQNAIAATGIAPAYDLESAIRRTLSTGQYSAILKGYSNGTGIASVEVYDVTGSPTSTPAPTPAPTPTPQPQRLLWQDTRDSGCVNVGRPNPHCCSGPSVPAVVSSSQLLSPAAAGLITVHFNPYAVGVCQYYCGPNPPPSSSWVTYARILNQFGTVVATGQGSQYQAVNYFNWSGAPLYVQIMADSQAYFPNNDCVGVTYFDVYGP